jgi:HD-GYP domain-containing protein (c-di-GMP phosphodiesterase class II)
VTAEQAKREKMSAELLAVLDSIELIVKQLVTAASQAALYSEDHPAAREYIENAFATVTALLARKASFAISVREEMLVYENIPLYRLSVSARKFIDLLKAKKVHGMIVSRGILIEELAHFVGVLVADPGKIQGREAFNRALADCGVQHIEAMELKREDEEGWSARAPKLVYQDGVHLMRRLAHAIIRGKPPAVGDVEGLADEIAEIIARDATALLRFASVRDYDEDLFTHPVNVCVYATALASCFIKEGEALRRLGQAALLHDIGKMALPAEILRTAAALSETQWELVRRHPAEGARILEEAERVDPLAVVVAYEHHMQYGMRGYPAQAGLEHPHPMCLVVQVANVYDALTSRRQYREARSPASALAEMLSGAGTVFEPRLVKAFAGLMGAFPPGTAVQLDTGEVGLVEKPSGEDIGRPTVLVAGEKEGEVLSADLNERNGRGGYVRSVEKVLDRKLESLDPWQFP